MVAERYQRLAAAGLVVAVVAWLGLASWVVLDLMELRDTAHVSEEAPRVMLLMLAPLAAAWALVLSLTSSSGGKRFFGAVIAQGLSAGAFAAILVLLLAAPLLLRTGPGKAAVEPLALCLLAQLPPFFLARPIGKALRSPGGASTRRIAALASGAGLVSFAFSAATVVWGPALCGPRGSAASARLRALMSSEAAYRTVSGGGYGTLECLVEPRACLPDRDPEAPVFVDPSFLEPLRCGYRFTFHAAAGADATSGAAGLAAWAMTAVPTAQERFPDPGFCADATGTLRVAPDGHVPTPIDGRCSERMEPVL